MISGLKSLLSSKSLFPIFIWNSAADSEFLWLFLFFCVCVQIKVLHKLSAAITAPWKAAGDCQDLSLFKHPGFPALTLLGAGVWGALSLNFGVLWA